MITVSTMVSTIVHYSLLRSFCSYCHCMICFIMYSNNTYISKVTETEEETSHGFKEKT
jgi:hypothetical protein